MMLNVVQVPRLVLLMLPTLLLVLRHPAVVLVLVHGESQ